MAAPIAFVTDFGAVDTYAAALAAACWRVDPSLHALTGMHGVPPGDVLAGAYHAKALARALPAGSVLCAVVDPGVGTARDAIAVAAGDILAVGPDNGLLSYVWSEAPPQTRRCVSLPVPRDAAATFHGRDVFAPCAARLAAGARLDDAGLARGDPLLHADAFARRDNGVVTGVVCVVDGFGNAVTTVRDVDVHADEVIAAEWAGGGTALVVRTYAEIPIGALALLLGSAGHWEIAAQQRAAADLGGPPPGAALRMQVRLR
ncbi:MAG TPA: SAM-dependent chlorinase/fluorinase [Candidatus Dormibacteraeota bacterium]|nr:SAM-dependent chlorinase/fluorinase [Candidatus Dormibacteraeota bacterium]